MTKMVKTPEERQDRADTTDIRDFMNEQMVAEGLGNGAAAITNATIEGTLGNLGRSKPSANITGKE